MFLNRRFATKRLFYQQLSIFVEKDNGKMKKYPKIGVQSAEIYLPKAGVDLTKWAVIACDQFTSEPEYWDSVEKLVGDEPSTLRMILPEVYLGQPDQDQRAINTQNAMKEYLETGILTPCDGFVLVERTINGRTRRGIMLALDLEQYDFTKGSQSLIRATEGTIIERLPPRIKIREGAVLELPHILVLIDDPQKTVIEPLLNSPDKLRKLYDFELMLGSGGLKGYLVDDSGLEAQVVKALEALADPQEFQKKYGVESENGVLLFAMGDGNHSLATAKAIWEKMKPTVGMDHPSRYALVEIENVHDESLEFEPIHRVIFNIHQDIKKDFKSYFGGNIDFVKCASVEEMAKTVESHSGDEQIIGMISEKGVETVRFKKPAFNLPVGTLQAFLDDWIKQGGAEEIDYVHGKDIVAKLGSKTGNLGFYLPGMNKSDLFKTVILDGALPRKTFSMGEAKEKRFYMECRKIS